MLQGITNTTTQSIFFFETGKKAFALYYNAKHEIPHILVFLFPTKTKAHV
jgi:hypothetical protein